MTTLLLDDPASQNGHGQNGRAEREKTPAQLISTVAVSVDGALTKPVGLAEAFYKKVRRMRRDPTIKMARWFAAAPILGGSWSYESRDDAPPGAKGLVREVMEDLRLGLLRTSLYGWMDYGWAPYERWHRTHRDGSLRPVLKPLLQDLTSILVLESTGEYVGLRQDPLPGTYARSRWIDLNAEESCVVYLDEEGTNWYGEPVMKALEGVFDEGDEIALASKKYMRRIAGSHWVIYYPLGTSKWEGVAKVDNGEIAAALLQRVESVGGLTLPRAIIDSVDSLNAQAAANLDALCWRVELLTDSGAGQTPMNERSSYLDKLKVRAFGFPERALLEGQFGTKAEAEAHADLAISAMEGRHALLCEQYNRGDSCGIVNDVLAKNYGPEHRDSVWVVPAPLADRALEFIKKLYELWFSNPAGFAEEMASIDKQAMRDRIGLPLLDQPLAAMMAPGPWEQDMQLMDAAAQPYPPGVPGPIEQPSESSTQLALAWDPEQHPRHEEGAAGSVGGQFREKEGGRAFSERLGDCYDSSWNAVVYDPDGRLAELSALLREEPMLAHGYPRFPEGHPKHGQRMGHAWAEVGPLVVDHGRAFPKALYYQQLGLEEDEVERYDAGQAMRRAVKARTYGPFEEPPSDAVFRESQGLPDLKPSVKRALDRIERRYPAHDSEAKETLHRYSHDGGKTWTRERARLHDAVVERELGRGERVPEPEYVLLGGGPASGKTTLVRSGEISDRRVVMAAADDIKENDLPEYAAMTKGGDKRASGYVHEESSEVAKRIVRDSLADGRSVVHDGTGDGSIKGLRKKVEDARAAGAKRVRAEYVTVSTAAALERAKVREERTKRHIDPDVVRGVHREVSRILPEAVKEGLFDTVRLWDTEDGSQRLVMSAKGRDMTVHDEALWRKFLAKGDEPPAGRQERRR
jgi:hypothetical protein